MWARERQRERDLLGLDMHFCVSVKIYIWGLALGVLSTAFSRADDTGLSGYFLACVTRGLLEKETELYIYKLVLVPNEIRWNTEWIVLFCFDL